MFGKGEKGASSSCDKSLPTFSQKDPTRERILPAGREKEVVAQIRRGTHSFSGEMRGKKESSLAGEIPGGRGRPWGVSCLNIPGSREKIELG